MGYVVGMLRPQPGNFQPGLPQAADQQASHPTSETNMRTEHRCWRAELADRETFWWTELWAELRAELWTSVELVRAAWHAARCGSPDCDCTYCWVGRRIISHNKFCQE